MRMMQFFVVLFILAHGLPAHAQNDMYGKMIALVKEQVWSGKFLGPDNMPMKTPPAGADKSIAYIPDSEAKQIILYGVLSGRGSACKLESLSHFNAMMKFMREKVGYSEYQMAYVGALHGFAQGMSEQKPCDSDEELMIKEKLEKNIEWFEKS